MTFLFCKKLFRGGDRLTGHDINLLMYLEVSYNQFVTRVFYIPRWWLSRRILKPINSTSTQFTVTLSSAGLPFRWFNLVVPKELSSKIFETSLLGPRSEAKDQPKEMRKILNKSSWLYLGPKIKLSGDNRFQWNLFLKTIVTITVYPTVTITPLKIWRWLNHVLIWLCSI